MVAAVVAAFSFVPQSVARAESVLEGSRLLGTARFTGQSDHVVSGRVQIFQKGDVYYMVLGEDFEFDGAPDPRLGFSTNDRFVSSSIFSSLNLDSGEQIYRLPATLDVTNFDEVTIWCEKFGVPLAEAKF